ncbi:hypothetical protein HY374_00430 [Candidatus Berkelbacteria bacterium]|nr:hypothetical protein [Candidatus Berkelbacteria bacterium]
MSPLLWTVLLLAGLFLVLILGLIWFIQVVNRAGQGIGQIARRELQKEQKIQRRYRLSDRFDP